MTMWSQQTAGAYPSTCQRNAKKQRAGKKSADPLPEARERKIKVRKDNHAHENLETF